MELILVEKAPHHNLPKNYNKMLENEWLQNLTDMCMNYDYLMPGDFGTLSMYGLVHRDGVEKIIVIDFGLTRDVLKTHIIVEDKNGLQSKIV